MGAGSSYRAAGRCLGSERGEVGVPKAEGDGGAGEVAGGGGRDGGMVCGAPGGDQPLVAAELTFSMSEGGGGLAPPQPVGGHLSL